MKRINITKKRIILLSSFLALFVIGTVLIFSVPISVKATYNKSTQTTDGVIISFNVFEPVSGGMSKPAIIIGHGFMANKEMLKGYALELAAAGFVAVPFDFRGHGQSTSGDTNAMFRDILAIKEYLNARSDINMNSLGYIGYSMGGLGQSVIHNDTAFKCFIGIGTWLYPTLRKGNSTNPLDVLMIQALFDEAITLYELKESVENRTGIPISNIYSNKIYGSFEHGNATMIYLDDDSNHLKLAWDQDFIREAKDWAINSFDIDVIDENFYVNIRAILLLIQVIGGIGFFFLIIEPLSQLILYKKEEKDRDSEIDFYKIDTPETSVANISVRTLIYSIFLGIPGIIIFIPIMLILPLAIAGFVVTLLFGQIFGLLILLWRMGKKAKLSFKDILKKPFGGGRIKFLRELALGVILVAILYVIAYFSIGLNYLALLPSIDKIWTIPIFFIIYFVVILIQNILMQMVIQNKFSDSLKDNLKIIFLGFAFPFLYFFIYLLIVAGITRSFFYFGVFIPIAIIMFILTSAVSVITYKKTGNIISASFINAVLSTFLVITMSPPQSGLAFILTRFL
ncbi:MAG: alpha/beta hydrolase [Promethearchaeota archaeon]|nr:MAG: alpha/beta hydrolase [Candidatus Lokiarchaeota archaeon]